MFAQPSSSSSLSLVDGSAVHRPVTLFDDVTLTRSPFGELCDALDVEAGCPWPDKFGLALQRWAKARRGTRVRTLSLFAGAGGLDIGFHDAGFSILEMVEIEQRFVGTLRANSGKGKYLGSANPVCQDICEYRPSPGLSVDFLIGGPPCQTFSAAGRRAAGVQGIDDHRGRLFREYVRLLRELRPRGFLFENVYGITGAQGGAAWNEITREFADAGYEIAFRVLDAADYGVPQHRERMFIVGSSNRKFRFPRPTHGPDSPDGRPYYTSGEATAGAKLHETESRIGIGGRYGPLLTEVPPGLNYSFFTKELGHPSPYFAWRSKFSDFLYKADPMRPVRTLKAQGGQYTGPFHWSNRPFGVGELKRLQTFPDAYDVVGGRQAAVHQIGNSVPPQIARILAISILEQLFDIKAPTPLPTLQPEEKLGFRQRKRSLTEAYLSAAELAHVRHPRKSDAPRKLESRAYTVELSEDFRLSCSDRGNWTVRTATSRGGWKFKIAERAPRRRSTGPAFARVRLAPREGAVGWSLPVSAVELEVHSPNPLGLTVAWKSFEATLIQRRLKADLVQLAGYYQYRTALSCEVRLRPRLASASIWRVLAKITSGVGVGAPLAGEELARALDIEKGEILRVAQELRALGYEVRNRKTNPQMRAGSFLIPYEFPTLNPQSVQLRKRLA